MVRKYSRRHTVTRELREPTRPTPAPQTCGTVKSDGTVCTRPQGECPYHSET